MNERGLWELFFATGLPEAYLAAALQRRENESRWEEPVKTAFQFEIQKV